MRLFLFFILLYSGVSNTEAQVSAQTDALIRRDMRSIQAIKSESISLPKDLKGEIIAMENAIDSICKDPDKRAYCEEMYPKFSLFKTKIREITEDIAHFHKEKNIADSIFQQINNTLKIQPGMPAKQYDQWSRAMLAPHLAAADRLLEKIKKNEGRLIKYATSYLKKNYWSKSPLITTVIRKYLEERRLEIWNDSLDRQQTKLDTLNKELSELTSVKKRLEVEKLRLGQERDDLAHKREALKKENAALIVEKNRWDSILQDQNKKYRSIEKNITELDILIKNKDQELDTLKKEIHLIEQQKIALTGKLDSLQKALRVAENSLVQKEAANLKLKDRNDRLQKENVGLEDELNTKNYYNKILKYALFFLAALGLFQLFQNLRKERRARKKLQNANEQLEEKREKLEALLRELHHRTKNNLQEISSLLYLQGKDSNDPDVKEVLNEARTRIDALGIVHRQLYQDKRQRFDSVEISSYTRELVEQLLKGNNHFKETVYTTYNIPTRYINTDTVIQIGLIINELVQNSCKYAFPGNPEPKLSLAMTEKDNRLYMVISDNGKGFPADFKIGAVNSFGLKLVNMLSKNTLQCENGTPGAIFRLNILLQPEETATEDDP